MHLKELDLIDAETVEMKYLIMYIYDLCRQDKGMDLFKEIKNV